jgi:hypothetical protein
MTRPTLVALLVIAGLTTAFLSAQISGTVVDDSGRLRATTYVDLTGPGLLGRVSLDGTGRFVFRDFSGTGPVWVQAFEGRRFSRRMRAALGDTALRLVLPMPRPGGLVAERTVITETVRDRGYDTTAIRCEGPQCSISVTNRVGQVFCWSTIIGAQRDTTIEHVWYWEEREMARVQLPVRGPRWRTWSSKTIAPAWVGAWRVEVVAADGTPLDVRFLTVRPSVR